MEALDPWLTAKSDWADAGQGWQGEETTLRLVGWSRQRRIILLRRKLGRDLAITSHGNPAQPRLGFAEVGPDKELWEYAALLTSLARLPTAPAGPAGEGRGQIPAASGGYGLASHPSRHIPAEAPIAGASSRGNDGVDSLPLNTQDFVRRDQSDS